MNTPDFSRTVLDAAMANAMAGVEGGKQSVGLTIGRIDQTKPYAVAAGGSACFGRTA